MTITLEPPAIKQAPMGVEPEEVSMESQPAQGAPAVPALRIQHLTKKFVVGGRRKRKTVVAVDDISLQNRAR